MNLAMMGFFKEYANIFIGILMVLNFFVCLLLIVTVLMQRSKNEGLGATFGGGTMDTAFGADTTNVLKKFTLWLTVAFFLLSIALSWFFAHRPSGGLTKSTLEKVAEQVDKNAVTPVNVPSTNVPVATVTNAPAATPPAPTKTNP